MTTKLLRMLGARLFLSACALVIAGIAAAQTGSPNLVNYQGFLKNSDGTVFDGNIDFIEFKIYDAPTGGSLLWNEAYTDLPVAEGVFNVVLGTANGLTETMFDDEERWLETVIDGEPLVPRRRFHSVPYAHRSSVAEVALSGGGGDDGDWTIDGSDVHRVDGRVGIGTATPSAKLEINDSSGAGPFAVIAGGGSVFENVSLQLVDRGTASGNANILELAHSGNSGGGAEPVAYGRMVSTSFGTNATFGVDLRFETSSNNTGGVNADQLVLQRSGRVGIGTDAPLDDLHVAGNLRADVVKATTNLGDATEPASGGVYRDNVILAWGKILPNGDIDGSFGVDSSLRVAPGAYFIELPIAIPDDQISVQVQGGAGGGSPVLTSAISTYTGIGTRLTISTWLFIPGSGGWVLNDQPFYFQVVGRPE